MAFRACEVCPSPPVREPAEAFGLPRPLRLPFEIAAGSDPRSSSWTVRSNPAENLLQLPVVPIQTESPSMFTQQAACSTRLDQRVILVHRISFAAFTESFLLQNAPAIQHRDGLRGLPFQEGIDPPPSRRNRMSNYGDDALDFRLGIDHRQTTSAVSTHTLDDSRQRGLRPTVRTGDS
jgi:hypothetical protein